MKQFMKSPLKKVVAMLMALSMVFSSMSDVSVLKAQAAEELSIVAGKGYEEGAYAKWSAVPGADSYNAYVSFDGNDCTKIDDELVRESGDYFRVDEVGLAAGDYTIKVEALADGEVIATATTESLTVTNYDRSGYAHYNYDEGVGAYNDDGTLKDNAIVLYVTDENKDTVSVTSKDGTTVTGIGHILNSTGMDVGTGATSKGGLPNNNQGIIKKLAEDGTPLVVRIIGTVTAPDGLTEYDSINYGGSVGDNGYMARMSSGKDITIEGIGSDAVIDGWGIHFICQTADVSAGFGKNFEVRNVSFKNVPEDCVGMEGQQEGSTLTAPVERCWIHDCAFYAPSIANPAQNDKDGGDGACDFKRGNYFTNSYCYYEGYHKTNLVGSSDSSLQYHLTYHHNYWKNCESRGPLARQANIHMYNNIFEGQTSYCMNPRANAYIFSEYNTFINCKNPVTVESGGVVKSYKDAFTSCIGDNHAEMVDDKSEQVSSSNIYANFDTNSTLGYVATGDYLLHDDLTEVRQVITAYTGPLLENPISSEEVSTSVILEDRIPTAAVSLPYSQALNSTYVASTSCRVDNIVFNVAKRDSNSLTVGGNATGQDIVFAVNTAVNITMEEVSGTYSPVLCNESGVAVLTGSGIVRNLPAGTYFIQSGGYDVGSSKFKEAKVASLAIEAYDPNEPTYNITVENDGNGTASANMATAMKGAKVTLTATPNSGYEFDSWQVVSGGVTVTSNQFTMPANDVTVRALFKEAAESGGGSGDSSSGDVSSGDGGNVGDGAINDPGGSGGSVIGSQSVIYDITKNGTSSAYFAVSGNFKTDELTSGTYQGVTYVGKPLKLESSGKTSITFTTSQKAQMVLFLDSGFAKKVKVDDVSYTASNGIAIVENLAAGSHSIAKGDTANLYAIWVIPEGGSGGDTSGGDAGDVTVSVTGVTLNSSSATLTTIGATTTLTATVAPDNATNKNVAWTSSNPAVATVNGGVVTAVANGETTITVTTEDGGKTATCQVTVAISAEDGGEVDDEITITESKGYQEGAYVEWNPVLGAVGYKAYVAKNGGNYTQIDDELIRKYADYWRVDAVGLAAGTYSIKIEAVMSNGSLEAVASNLSVIAYERVGFAWVNGTASGAYNEDGTLKSDAVVLYITENTKDSVSMDVVTGSNGATTGAVGLQNILNAYQKGYDSRPLAIRLIGNITDFSTLQDGDILIKGSGDSKRLSCGITFEGIGEDATANGWGLRIANASNVEVRNLGFMNCNSGEGDNVGLQQNNDHVWVHDNDFFYGDAGSDADQAKGDGALDTKKSTYVTHSYNHFWDTGKTHLNGNGETNLNYITYHHNWYDHSDSRHPLVRCSTAVHVYNNLYDGVSKYGMIARMGSSIFAESNYFKDTKSPILISQQGTDIASGEPIASDDGGMIKSYGNVYDNTTAPIAHTVSATSFDCYEATTATEVVPDTYVTLKGGTAYSNFDTAEGFYSYTAETAANAKTTVETYAGRVNGGDFSWDFSDPSEDTNYAVNTALKAALQSYTSNLVAVGGMQGASVDPGQGNNPVVSYTIIVDLADGSATSSFNVSAGEAITSAQLPTPTREGYSFTGWVDGTGKAVVLPYTPTANMTIKATWQQDVSSGDVSGGDLDPDTLYNLKLNAEDLPAGTYTESFSKNGFTINAGEGSEKCVYVDANNKTINGTRYTQRLKLGGAGTKDYRSIMFTAKEAATLQIGCMASNSSATFQLAVATLDENGAFVDLKEGFTIDGNAADSSNGSISVNGSSAHYITVAIPAAGTYYIYGKDGGINFYFLNLLYAGGVDAPNYTVTFNTMGGLSVDAQTVMAGEACVQPADTLRAGYTFGGWYADYDCTVAYDFSKPITGNITIFAKWIEGEEAYTSLVLDMKDLPARDYKENFTKHDFVFSANSSKPLAVDKFTTVVDGVTYTQRLKFGGSGSTTERNIGFTITEDSKVTLVAESGSAGTARSLAISNGATTYDITNIDAAAKYTQELSAGTWYVYSTNNGVNVYYIAVEPVGGSGGPGESRPDGLCVELANPGEEYIYTGSAIKPAIVVYNNGEELTAGVDYTVKYSNNTAVSTAKKIAKITVTGKGNLTGSASTTFVIQPKDIGDADIVEGEIIVAKNTAATPVLLYNNKKLTTKDYVKDEPKKKFTEDGVLKITGKGNFTGTREIPVKVVDKNALGKFNVKVDTKTVLTYDGNDKAEAIYAAVTVTDKKDKTKELTRDVDYIIDFGTYSTVNAGTVKFTIVGIGNYTGTVAKSMKIKPIVAKEGITYDAEAINAAGYTFVSSGVKIDEDIVVKYGDVELTQGKDYKVTYSNNKKVSTAKSPAKFTITFLGNYKGSKALKGTFIINPQPLSDEMDGIKIVAADKIYSKKNVYKSAPIVTIDGVTLKSSNYTVKYYLDASMSDEFEMTSKNKLELKEDQTSATVYVKITGKGNYAPVNGEYATTQYTVSKKDAEDVDLSKARVTVVDAEGKKLTKVEYTGNELEPQVKVEVKVKVGKKTEWQVVEDTNYEVTYMNNVKKGTATVVINATGDGYVGSKTAKFKIVAKNLKSLPDLLKELFGL